MTRQYRPQLPMLWAVGDDNDRESGLSLGEDYVAHYLWQIWDITQCLKFYRQRYTSPNLFAPLQGKIRIYAC